MSQKNYCQEHTKPLFSKHKIMNLPNLYVYHTFLDLFKILKKHTPISLFTLFEQSQRGTNFLLHLPKVNLNISKNNFVYNSCILWNSLIGNCYTLYSLRAREARAPRGPKGPALHLRLQNFCNLLALCAASQSVLNLARAWFYACLLSE